MAFSVLLRSNVYCNTDVTKQSMYSYYIYIYIHTGFAHNDTLTTLPFYLLF